MGTFNLICDKVELLNYKVNKTRQEKIVPGEVVILLKDINVEVESPASYVETSTITIQFVATDPDLVAATVAQIIRVCESLGNSTMKFLKPVIDIPGTLYNVTLSCTYREVIDL